MKPDHEISNEQRAYEFPELWEAGMFGAAEQEKVQALASSIPPDARTLLDVGCGNGFFLHHLTTSFPDRFSRICGVDRSLEALRHVSVEKRQASVDRLPFKDSEFDIVTCNDVLEHLPLAVYSEARRELARVSKRYVMVNLPFDEDVRGSLLECPSCFCRFNVNYHLRSFRKPDVEHLFDEHGLRCLRTWTMVDVEHPPKWMTDGWGTVKRVLFRRRESLPTYAVCPACGFVPERGHASTAGQAGGPSFAARAKQALRAALPRRYSHRWIAGIFVRQ